MIHKDRVTIVTGAGLSLPNDELTKRGSPRNDLIGIGAAIAMEFARQGAHVICADISGNNAERLATKINTDGGKATPYQLDVTDNLAVRKFFDNFGNIAPRLDTLVNNVGFYKVVDDPFEVDDEEWDRAIALNLTSNFLMTRGALRMMKQSGNGGIIGNVASDAGIKGAQKAYAPYSAAKGGVIAQGKSAARSGKGHGIRCFSLCPGPCNTPGLWMNWPVDAIEEMKRQMFTGKLVEPEEIGLMMSYLCDPRLPHLTLAAITCCDGLAHH